MYKDNDDELTVNTVQAYVGTYTYLCVPTAEPLILQLTLKEAGVSSKT